MEMKYSRQQIEALFPIGMLIKGRVLAHYAFGIFINIGINEYSGLIQITDFLDGGVMTTKLYPEINEPIVACVLAYNHEAKQIWLSVKPSVLESKNADSVV